MLVASTAVGLFSPIAAQAAETINLEDMNSYVSSSSKSQRLDNKTFINEVSEKLSTSEGRVDGFQAQQNNLEAGTFSDTTTLDGKVVFTIGSFDTDDGANNDDLDDDLNGKIQSMYSYTMNLNTSFSGDDNLYIRLKAGENGTAWASKPAGYHIETKDTSDSFNVDKIWYSFPIGDNITGFVGPRIENYYMYVTPSIYKPGALKAFKLGGNSNFGASTDVGFGLKYEADNGFAIATNVVDKNADGNSTGKTGFFQDDGVSKWDTQIAYTQDRYHLSLTVSNAQNWTSQIYNATALGENTATDSMGYAARAYWIPEESGTAVPEISIGYDTKVWDDAAAGTVDEADSWMIGLTWKDIAQADDRIGVALTQPLKATSISGGGATNEVDPLLWEVYYSWKANDSMTITPAVFGGSDSFQEEDDTFGAVVTTAFKF